MSAKVAIGSIPEKICYVFSREEEVYIGCAWDVDWFDQSKNKKVQVLPAFPIEDGDEKAQLRAIQWAEKAYYNQPVKEKAQIDVVENKPIHGVRVCSVEHRGQGGRAYKAIINKYYVDLREDVLMDTILQSGIAAGGVLLGEYIWAKVSGQMKLVRMGSELHRLIAEFDSKKDIKPIGKDELEIGGVYQTRKKEKSIFLGYVNTIIFSIKGDEDSDRYSDTVISFDLNHKTIKKAMLFYEVNDFDSLEKNVKDIKLVDSQYRFKIKKSHNFIEKADQVEVPENIVSFLRTRAQKQVKEYILEYTGHKEPEHFDNRFDSWGLRNQIIYESDHLNLSEYGAPDIVPFDVKKYLLFS